MTERLKLGQFISSQLVIYGTFQTKKSTQNVIFGNKFLNGVETLFFNLKREYAQQWAMRTIFRDTFYKLFASNVAQKKYSAFQQFCQWHRAIYLFFMEHFNHTRSHLCNVCIKCNDCWLMKRKIKYTNWSECNNYSQTLIESHNLQSN